MAKPVTSRPSRGELQRRLGYARRAVIVLAAASFAGIATLAAGKATAGGSTKAQHTSTQLQQSTSDDGSGYFGDDGGGSVGNGSGQSPMTGSGAS